MNEVPVIRETINARVLAHRRNHDAIAELDFAQLHRGKEMGCLRTGHTDHSPLAQISGPARNSLN
jgi:hypothetical protein